MKSPFPRFVPALTASLLVLAPSLRAQTATSTVLANFAVSSNPNGPTNPLGALIQDGNGNFYGTTNGGGANGLGSIYEVTAAGQYVTLYSFTANDGQFPNCPLYRTSDGSLYGSTFRGGANNYGTVFQLTPAGVLNTLHSFNLTDGRGPVGGFIVSGGTFFGVTAGGGVNNTGTIYQLAPDGTLTTLHSFVTADGTAPQNGLIQAGDGKFYGTTSFNGTPDNRSAGNGTVYSYNPNGGVYTVLHQFDDTNDGNGAFAGLIQGRDGAFYGSNPGGGANGQGTLFKVTTGGTFTVLHTFSAVDASNDNADGASPVGTLIDGGDGRFYGTTNAGGSGGQGTLFALTPTGVLTTLYNFGTVDQAGVNTDGGGAYAALLKAQDGRFYLPTTQGGAAGAGTVDAFTVTQPHPAFFDGEVALANNVEYLSFPAGNIFGYYTFRSDANYLYHFDLGDEYLFDANDGQDGVFLYDFKSSTYFYTSPTFPFPYLYDFSLNTVLYYFPDPNNPGRYNTNGVRYFYNFKTGQIITK
ncbi:MAG: hypothetical protein INR62_00895 [Rhodospirillales bacterium]|nr:hypothetical protein [Acetobacter sp.]